MHNRLCFKIIAGRAFLATQSIERDMRAWEHLTHLLINPIRFFQIIHYRTLYLGQMQVDILLSSLSMSKPVLSM